MNLIFQNTLGLLLVYKYITLFFITFFSSLGIPLPAGLSTVASSAFASQGYFNIWGVLIMAVLGNILGDMSMYFLSRKYGKKFFYWLHLKKLIESKLFRQIEEVANNYSPLVIIASRFQDQITTIVNIVAGLGNIKFKRFALYAIIGDALQIIFYASIGYFFAENWQALYNAVGMFSWLIVLATVIISILASKKIIKIMAK
jgi:membrane-associated protein